MFGSRIRLMVTGSGGTMCTTSMEASQASSAGIKILKVLMFAKEATAPTKLRADTMASVAHLLI